MSSNPVSSTQTMAAPGSDFQLSIESLSIRDDPGNVAAATELPSSHHNARANFMIALQQGSDANPVTQGMRLSFLETLMFLTRIVIDAPFQHVDPRLLNMAMATLAQSTGGGANQTENSRSARHAPYRPGPSSSKSINWLIPLRSGL